MSTRQYKRNTPSNNDFREVASHLLCLSCSEPIWDFLPRRIKHELHSIINSSYSIDNEQFYNSLHKKWAYWRSFHQDRDIQKIDCSICLNTYKLNGKDKLTTLLCGHHFCSPCIMKHIEYATDSNRYNRQPSCPMCRGNIFHNPQSNETHLEPCVEVDSNVALKREKRRQERFRKHQAKQRWKTSMASVDVERDLD